MTPYRKVERLVSLLRKSVIAGAMIAASSAACGETLRGALLKAYRTNPDLTAARARLRATDENVAIAKSFGRPQASGVASVTQEFDRLGRPRDRGRIATGTVGLSYPIFTGGRVANSVRAAKARVVATRADLRDLEGDVFAATVTAYMDVVRDAYIVTLNEGQVGVLETDFRGSKDRFEAGDLTRTDVAQSEARLANARSQLVSAQGALVRSRETYRQIVGDWPIDLTLPPPLPTLPPDPDRAVAVGLDNAPELAAGRANEEATGFDVRVARAERLPTLSADASAAYTNYLGSQDRVFGIANAPGEQSNASVGLTAAIPLYQGGRPAARVRQARALQDESSEQTVGLERAVVARVRAAFSDRQVADAVIIASEAAVAANRLALRGTRAENNAGTRLLIDVLNAQQELLISEVALIAARRDAYVAGFNLLNAMGRGDLASLDLSAGALYDPLPNYVRADRSISDWRDGRDEPTLATPTTGPTPIDAPATQVTLGEDVTRSQAESISRPPLTDPTAPPR